MLPSEKFFGQLEVVHTFSGAMPTGVTISETGRIFVCFPKWGDDVPFTVGEIVNGTLKAYPNLEVNTSNDKVQPSATFISVQSVVADGRGTLWVLDTGSPNFSKPMKGGAKLVAIDLKTNKIKRTYTFQPNVVLDKTYLNDVRIDYRVGKSGYAYITDSGSAGIIIVDLENERAFRRLDGAKSTSPDPYFVPKVEGALLMDRSKDGKTEPLQMASDGIAISPDGRKLFFCPLSSRHLFAISTEVLRDQRILDHELLYHVEYWGEKGASDGMITDAHGNIYAGDYEHNAIRKIRPNGEIETIVHTPTLLWPDTLSIGPDQYLYVIVNQLHRQARFHYGKDLREKPYALVRLKIGQNPAPTS